MATTRPQFCGWEAFGGLIWASVAPGWPYSFSGACEWGLWTGTTSGGTRCPVRVRCPQEQIEANITPWAPTQMSWQLSTDRMLRCVCVATFALSAGDPFSAVPLTCALRHRSGSEGAIDSPRSLRNRPMLRLRYLCRGVSAASSCSRILLLKTPG